MKHSTLELLLCPTCHSSLQVQGSLKTEEITNGSLCCSVCQKIYPIKHGIPHFIKEQELLGLNKPFARMYDWFSWIYSAFSKIGFLLLGTTDAKAREEVISRLQPHGKVLEVSIGPGVNLPHLLKTSGVQEIYGLDISIGQLNRWPLLCRRRPLASGSTVASTPGVIPAPGRPAAPPAWAAPSVPAGT
jgi:uncharacterized protein YbaR (Trm112 family)